MERIPLSGTTLERIRDELERCMLTRVLDGSGHAGPDFRAGWINGLSNTRLFLRDSKDGHIVTNDLTQYRELRHAIAALRIEHPALGKMTQFMVNKLDAGGKLSAHRDGLPDDYRFHLPVFTNRRAVWWDEHGGTMHMDEGYWHGPVPYCGVLHAAANYGPLPRLHVVADFSKKNCG